MRSTLLEKNSISLAAILFLGITTGLLFFALYLFVYSLYELATEDDYKSEPLEKAHKIEAMPLSIEAGIEVNISLPIYEVYKNNHFIDVDVELQWFIRHMAEEHGYPERLLYGVILTESTFNSRAVSGNGEWRGLMQLSRWWLHSPPVKPYRLTDDYSTRCLYDPYLNILTTIEIWNYARDTYEIDVNCENDVIRLLKWHSGQCPRITNHCNYTRTVFRHADELVEINYSKTILPTELILLV